MTTKPEFLNDLESLLIELHAATQEVKLHGEKHDEYWKAYKSASDELDIANCFNNQCDPTEK